MQSIANFLWSDSVLTPDDHFESGQLRELPIETPPGFDIRMQFWTGSFLPGRTHAAPTLGRLIARRTLSSMPDQTYLVTLRPPSHATQQVFAATAEVRGSHLVFVDAKGNLAALFLLDLVERWSVLPTKMPVRGAAQSSRGKAGARAVRGQALPPL